MLKKIIFHFIFILFLLNLSSNICLADYFPDAFSPIKTIKTDESENKWSQINVDLSRQTGITKDVELTNADSFYNLTNATDKFVQGNIRASWEGFKSFIDTIQANDFQYLSIANKMSDLGFFDLANYANSRIQDKELTGLSMDAMKRYYFPRNHIKLEDELYLSEVYSNITFNNQAAEATNELLEKENLLSNYDYANYLVALGSYKANFYPRAAKYINIALLQNPSNINYLALKAKILADKGDTEDVLKLLETLKKQKLYSFEYEQKIKSNEQFVLYKIAKSDWEKDYHLGYYYYFENDYSKAIRTLQDSLELRKRANKSLVYGLMSEIYFDMDEFEKASDMAQKAHNINSNNSQALLTLGKLNYMKNNYKQALSFYKKAASSDKKDYAPIIEEAKTYQKLSKTKKANELYDKVLKTHSDCWEAYYNVALIDKNKRTIYLKKALAVNPLFEDGWIELAKTQISVENYDTAQKYLANAFYIDENDFRYYYYQGVVDNNSGKYEQAKFNFKKCLKLNTNFTDAKNALNNILNNEDNNTVQQDNI